MKMMKRQGQPGKRHAGSYLSGAAVAAWLLLPGCSAFAPDEPAVADSTLVEVMADLHLLQARAASDFGVPGGLRDSILARHGVDASDYEEAMRYYVEHPEEYADVYRRVLDHLAASRVEAFPGAPPIP